MTLTEVRPLVQGLSRAEKLQLADELVAEVESSAPIHPEVLAMVIERQRENAAHPESSIPWDDFVERRASRRMATA